MSNTDTIKIDDNTVNSVIKSVQITLNSKYNQEGLAKYGRHFIQNTTKALYDHLYTNDGLDVDRLTSLAAIAMIGLQLEKNKKERSDLGLSNDPR